MSLVLFTAVSGMFRKEPGTGRAFNQYWKRMTLHSIFYLQKSPSQLWLTSGTSRPALLIIRDVYGRNKPPGAGKPCAQYKSGFQHSGHLKLGFRPRWSLRPQVKLGDAFSLSHLTLLGDHS